MPDESQAGVAANLAYYTSSDGVAAYAFYSLLGEEEYVFRKYFNPGDTILDLACGLGRTTLLLHEMGARVRGVDRSKVFIELAKRRFPYLDLRVGSYDSIDEEDASFAKILIALNGIDYAIPEAQRLAVLRECARVLKPGGTLVFSSHNLKSLHWFSPYYRTRRRWKLRNVFRAFGTHCYIWDGAEYIHYTVPKYVVPQTEAAGLRLLEIRGFNRFRSARTDQYFSPYLQYVFTKPMQ